MRDRLDALVAVGDDDPHSPLHRIKTGSFVFERGRPAGAALESAPHGPLPPPDLAGSGRERHGRLQGPHRAADAPLLHEAPHAPTSWSVKAARVSILIRGSADRWVRS